MSYNFILVVVAVIRALGMGLGHLPNGIVLVHIHVADIGLAVLIINIVGAAVTAA